MSSEIWDRQMKEYIDRYARDIGNRPQSRVEFDGVSVMDITERVVTRAANDALDAGYSGDSGAIIGASNLIATLKTWLQGLDNELPEKFREDCVAILKEEDPEYKRYLELKAKFDE